MYVGRGSGSDGLWGCARWREEGGVVALHRTEGGRLGQLRAVDQVERRARVPVERHHAEVEQGGHQAVAADRVRDELEGEGAFAVAGARGVDLKAGPVLDQRLGRVVVLRRREADGQGDLGLGFDDGGFGQGQREGRAAGQRGDSKQGDRGVAYVAHGGGGIAGASHHHRAQGEAAFAG